MISRLKMTVATAIGIVFSTPPAPSLAEQAAQQTSVPVALENERPANGFSRNAPREEVDVFQFNPVTAFEAHRATVSRDGFQASEEVLLADASSAARLHLVNFYMAHGFYAEALALPLTDEEGHEKARREILNAISLMMLGRWADARDILSSNDVAKLDVAVAWRALAQAKLGAYETAAEDFFVRSSRQVPHEENAILYYLARAETALETDHLDEVRPALDHLRNRTLNAEHRAARRLIEGKAMLLDNRASAARSIFSQLANENTPPYSQRAEIEILKIDLIRGDITANAADEKLDDLALVWRGGAFERELFNARALFADKRGDIEVSMAARRALVDGHADADIAVPALVKMKNDIAGLFERTELAPALAARVFYENIDLAPPGRDGDRLIRNVIDQLIALDLMSEASELLEHQTFNRLRGEARSIAAADLAAIYLEQNAPDAALTALENSARTRLDPHVQNRRSLLRAKAHLSLGNDTAALNAVADVPTKQAIILRGDIAWKREDYSGAGAAYWSAVNLASTTAAITGKDIDYVLKVAAAYSLSDEHGQLRSIVNDLDGRITDPDVLTILDVLATPGFENASDFLGAYKHVFTTMAGEV